MDIVFIKTFLELSRTRHFGKTAQSLFITQSAVSSRIKHLEEQLGVKLLTRDRNNIQLTPAGNRFQKHAEKIVTMWNQARLETALEDENMSLLSIGGVFSLWDTVLQQWLVSLKNANGDIAYRAEALGAETIVSRVLDGSLDLGFLFEFPTMDKLQVEEIGSIELVMVSNKSLKNVDEAVSSNQYILVDWGTEFSSLHARFFPDISPPTMRVNQGRIALHLILNAGGSAYLPQIFVAPYLEKGALHVVPDAATIQRKFYAIYSTAEQRQPLMTNLQASLKPFLE